MQPVVHNKSIYTYSASNHPPTHTYSAFPLPTHPPTPIHIENGIVGNAYTLYFDIGGLYTANVPHNVYDYGETNQHISFGGAAHSSH